MPAAIENVSGMPAIVRKAGIEASGSDQSMSVTMRIIR
jgi:hypothetical protein